MVMPNQEITYYDTISEGVVDTLSVPYGHEANVPKSLVHEGHTFSKWQLAATDDTEDETTPEYEKVTKLRYETVYDRNSYTVKFYDSFTNELLKTQTLKYEDAAEAPSVIIPSGYEGYALAGWSKDFSSVKSDMDVYTVYKWDDKDHSATATINSVTRNTTKQGYDVSITISNKISEISSGRVVAVLKSTDGVILTTVESSAFAIDALEDKTIIITVLYSNLASQVEVYVVNGFDTLGKITKTATADIDNSTSSGFSEWIVYEGDCPMEPSDSIVVECDEITDVTPSKTYYRYQIKDTATSYATSLSGYTQNGYTKVKASTGTVNYVASWPSGFDKTNTYYTSVNNRDCSAVSRYVAGKEEL